ncbi:MAG: T9SS type A sorting domain-containing protein [Bacteroidia bacterium]|nr:T9SS type A sorting domain-containing protein [Bacteroidia bacterium]
MMKLKFLPVLFLLACCQALQAQSSWFRTYTPDSIGNEVIYDMAPLAGGGFAAVGNASTSTGGSGDGDILLMRFNDLGEVLWAKSYDGGGMESGLDIEVHPGGGFVISASRSVTAPVSDDLLVFRTDSSGNISWTYRLTGSGTENINSLLVNPSGTILLTGNTGLCQTAFSCAYALLLDENGNVLWNRSYEKDNACFFNSAISTSDGGFLFTGYTLNLIFDQNGWVLKADSNGVMNWSNTYVDASLEQFNHATENTLAQGYVLVGETTPNLSSNADVLVGIIDYSGNYIGGGFAGGPEDDRALNVHPLFGTSVLITGQTYVDTLQNSFIQGLALEVNVATGALGSSVYIGNSVSNNEVYCSAIDQQGYLLMAGTSNQFSGFPSDIAILRKNVAPGTVCFENPISSIASFNAYTLVPGADTASITFTIAADTLSASTYLLTDSLVCGTTGLNETAGTRSLKFSPNPASDMLRIETPMSTDCVLEILNINGQLMLRKTLGTGQNPVSVGALEEGVYIIRLLNDREILTGRFVKAGE